MTRKRKSITAHKVMLLKHSVYEVQLVRSRRGTRRFADGNAIRGYQGSP